MSKEIQIRRKEPTSYLPAAVIAEAKRNMGSVFVNSTTLKGLSFDEEQKYLPAMIGISASSPSFEQAALNFWRNFRIQVPSDGIVLNIGLDEKNEPINLSDWIKYQWAIKHPFMAMTKEKMIGQKQFYIHNPEVVSRATNNKLNAKKAAYRELIQISDNPDKLARVVRVLGKKNPVGMTKQDQENMVGLLVDSDPEGFYKVVTDKNLEMQDTILHLTDLGILHKIGASYLYLDTEIGGTMEESILFMRNKRNSQAVAEMKAKLKELVPTTAKPVKKSVEKKTTDQENPDGDSDDIVDPLDGLI